MLWLWVAVLLVFIMKVLMFLGLVCGLLHYMDGSSDEEVVRTGRQDV